MSELNLEDFKRHLLENLFSFAHFAGFSQVNANTHSEIITALEAPTKRKVIVVPRGTFKSTLCSITYPLWMLLRNPDLRILIESEVFANSVTYLRAIKTIIKSEKFLNVFGDLQGFIWRDDSIVVSSRQKTLKEPSIVCGGVDTTKVGMHYDLIISDDLNSPANSDTPEKCQRVIDHYRYNLNILEPDGVYVIIGTRYSDNDLIGWVLRDVLNQPKLSEGDLEYYLSKG